MKSVSFHNSKSAILSILALPILALAVFSLASATALAAKSPAPTRAVNLIFIDNSVSSESYITSNNETQMNQAVKMAVVEVQSKMPECNIKQVTMIGRNDPLNIFKQKEAIEKNYSSENTLIVGLKNSGETNLAAEAFKTTKYLALSSGVSSDDLGQRNPRFFFRRLRARPPWLGRLENAA